jgi:hypothetical protein
MDIILVTSSFIIKNPVFIRNGVFIRQFILPSSMVIRDGTLTIASIFRITAPRFAFEIY